MKPETRGAIVNERVRFLDHEGKQILLVDMSGCNARDVEEIARKVPDFVTAQDRASALILTDFTGASFDKDAAMAIKKSAVFDRPFVRKSALVGIESLPRPFYENLKSFSRREWATFGSRTEALAWLIKD